MLGNLTLDALPHDPIAGGGAAMVVGGGLTIVIALFVTKRWTWLWKEWLTSLDPKRIGIMYLIVALAMLLRGFADALMIRTQQALASGDAAGILTSDHFQQVFSAHGTIMIFFVAMGLIFGIINLILPLQLGSRDVAFPFLNSVSFWLFIAGFILINASLVIGEFSAAGWLAYPPLSGIEYSPGVGVDYWIWALQISGIGSLLSGINFMVTIFKMRAPGMTLMKMPIFAWSVLCSMSLVAFAFPILTVTLTLLSLDRLLGMHFFTSDMGGNPMMYINLIWAWGHPEVYILVLPAFGIFSEIVATFSSKRLFGYASMVWALGAITVLSFIVWLHHFFTMGAGANVNAFFGIMTAVIAIPTGVKIFNWLFTMYGGRIRFTTPMLWFMGFVVTFTLGGVTGVLMSVPAIDFQVHNSLFLIAHFHTMIIGGVVFGFFAGFTYWFPKIFGFKLNERLGVYAFWLWLIGFLMAFVPLYILGLMGATRRLDHYDASLGWQGLFVVAGIGVLVLGLGVLCQIAQLVVSIRQRNQNRDTTGDPWGGRTLEWATPSPAPIYNFAQVPEVTSRDAFWMMKERQRGASAPRKSFSPITIPNNSSLGVAIGMLSFLIGFGLIWHIFWLACVGIVGIIIVILIRTTGDEDETELSAVEVERIDAAARHETRKKRA
ncbi:cytochrome o ubiquinol oxidase subunit I [Candidatus Saccharibacteria bacterium RIFCSPHIGHO2_01_FULL_45_15]|nr:MAG: cytochrome o ubiquinol oxidase subunit I [Candidatus Saccharibacteria bacterium RIFCSPHIGHO2_01_FULL_45_15]OGL27767.1 MAG: cytochrome o ubiquinol oxidase subunit I [Candidatus Saccharibacteria bacterium RIFCSPHIGHO2_02_FULL_46_12]OGL31656.1 MAG: cytochrome o ubiquinol oxidase subunit I [Candidatus Saccharibacteria bacterium RIFCSPHIGHO2_12_FULL_44_22]